MKQKFLLLGIILILIIAMTVLIVNYSKKPINNVNYGSEKNLSDEDLLNYAKTSFNKEKMMFKEIIIGKHNEIPIKVSFPCSDVCPDYTIRIIRYDVELDKCEEVGGIKKAIYVPFSEAMIARGFCFPKVFVLNEVYDFAEDLNLLIEELRKTVDRINYCNEKSDCSYKKLDACDIPVIAFNKNADLTEFNKKFEEYKIKLPSRDFKIKVDSIICEANKCVFTYSLQQ